MVSQRADLARHVERQLRAQERQIVAVRFVVVALSAAALFALEPAATRSTAVLAVLAAIAVYNLAILLLVGRFPAREVGIVATALDMVAVSVVVYVSPTLADAYVFYGLVILSVALRFGLWAAIWSAVVITLLYAAVMFITPGPVGEIRDLLAVRAAYLLGFGVAGGLFSRVVIARTEENARLAQRLEQEQADRARAREAEVLSGLSRELGASLEREAAVRAVVRAAEGLLGNLNVVLAADHAERALRVAAVSAPDTRAADAVRRHLEGHPIRIGGGPIGGAAATATTTLIASGDDAAGVAAELLGCEGLRGLLTVPLLSRGTVHGVLVNASASGDIVHRQQRLAEAIAERAGPALENAVLWGDLQEQVQRMEALQQLVADITSNLARGEIMDQLSASLVSIFGADRAAIFVRDEGSGRMMCGAARNLSAAFTALLASEGLEAPAGFGALAREPRFILDARSDPRTSALHDAARAEGIASILLLPLLYGGDVVGAITLYHDRPRDWDDAELSLARTFADQAAIALSNAELFSREKRAQRIKDDFLSIVSHELRTPLTSIQGYSQLLESRLRMHAGDGSGGEGKEMAHLRVIRSQVQRMRRLVDDLLDVSRIDRRGGVSIEPQPIDLAAELRDVVARLQREHPEREIHLDAPEAIPMEADHDRVAQVLTNLTDNAVKYSPNNGPIRLEAMVRNGEAQVRVIDEGIGIAAEHIGHLFERFYQADGDRSRRRFGGLGLGLYICQAIVDAHGGRIWAEHNTAAGRGSIFVFRLPLRSAVRPPLAAEGAPPEFVTRRRAGPAA